MYSPERRGWTKRDLLWYTLQVDGALDGTTDLSCSVGTVLQSHLGSVGVDNVGRVGSVVPVCRLFCTSSRLSETGVGLGQCSPRYSVIVSVRLTQGLIPP